MAVEPVFGDAEVIDDLEGEAHIEDDSGDEDDEGHDGGGSSEPMDVEDDSIHSFEGHTDAVLAVAFSPVTPGLVATGGMDDKAFMWHVGQDGYESTAGSLGTYELTGHTDTVASLGFSVQGNYLATGGMDGLVKVWDTSNGSLVQTLEGPGGSVDWLRWHPKGNVVLAGSDDMTMWMWLASTGACMQVFSGHSGPIVAGAFTPDGKHVVSVGGEDDCSLRVWNPKNGECTVTIAGYPFHQAPLTCVAVHHDSALTLTGAEDGTVRICNINLTGSHRVLSQFNWHEDSVEAVGFSTSLPCGASAGVDGILRVWDLNQTVERAVCEHPNAITQLAWHPTQPLVFTGCADGFSRLWDLRTGQMVRKYGGHTDSVQALAVSADGSMLLSGADDNTAKVFMTAGGM